MNSGMLILLVAVAAAFFAVRALWVLEKQWGDVMAEPGSTVAGGVAGYKLMLLGIPLIAAVVGFWLGLRFVPLRKGKELQDVTHRMTACAVSSFVLGLPALVLLQQYAPGSIQALLSLGMLAQLPDGVAVLALVGTVFLVCSVPGPWLVAAVFLYMDRRKGKDIGELVAEARGKGAGGSQ